MKKDTGKPRLLYTGPNHPLGAGYFLIYIGYTQSATVTWDRQLIRLDKGWVLHQLNRTLTRPPYYHQLHLSTTEAWQLAANHGQALKFKLIEALVVEIRKDSPGINSLLLQISKPLASTRQICRPTLGRRSYLLQ